MNWRSKISRRDFARLLPCFGIVKVDFFFSEANTSSFDWAEYLIRSEKVVDDPVFLLLEKVRSNAEKLANNTKNNYDFSQSLLTKTEELLKHYTGKESFAQLWKLTNKIDDYLYPYLFDSFLSIDFTGNSRLFDDNTDTTFEITQQQQKVIVTVLAITFIKPVTDGLTDTLLIEKPVIISYNNNIKRLKLTLNAVLRLQAGNIQISNLGFPQFYDEDKDINDPFTDVPAIDRTNMRRSFITHLNSSLKAGGFRIPVFTNLEFDVSFSPHYYVIRNNQFYLFSRKLQAKVKRSILINRLLYQDYPVTYFIHQDLFRELLRTYISRKLERYQSIPNLNLKCHSFQGDLKLTIQHVESRDVFLFWDVDIEAKMNLDYYIRLQNHSRHFVSLHAVLYSATYSYSIEDCPTWKLDEAAQEVESTIRRKIRMNQQFNSPFDFSDLNFFDSKGIIIPGGLVFTFK